MIFLHTKHVTVTLQALCESLDYKDPVVMQSMYIFKVHKFIEYIWFRDISFLQLLCIFKNINQYKCYDVNKKIAYDF